MSSITSAQLSSDFGRQLLSNLVQKRTYAETKPDGKKESHDENVERVIAHHVKRFPKMENVIREAFSFVKSKHVLPSMRSMQFAGYSIERSEARMYNCIAVLVNSFKDIADTMWFSMNGSGVGYSIQHCHVRNLPVVSNGDSSEVFVIPDTKEGWADSILRLLQNPKIKFDYSLIRPEGAALSTGGTASGPFPLRQAHVRIRAILSQSIGRQLRPYEVHEIICHQSDAVVVGGVRRAALICLFSDDDTETLTSKIGHEWRKTKPWLERANNSVVLLRTDPDIDEKIRTILDTCFDGFSGELGLFITNDLNVITNPCQPDTATVLTPEGVRTLREIDRGSIIWSGDQWTKVLRKVHNGKKLVYRYKTTAGEFVGTSNHRILSEGLKIEVGSASSIDRSSGPKGYDIPALDDCDIMDGLVFGDGTVHKASNNAVFLVVGDHDRDYFNSTIAGLFIEERSGVVGPKNWSVRTSITAEELPRTFEREIPERFIFSSRKKTLGFLKGLYSANGSVTGNRITLKASSFNVIRDVQVLLSSFGISSYYTTNKATEVTHANGVFTSKQSYDLNISAQSDQILFLELTGGFLQSYKNDKLRSVIESRTKTRTKHKVSYDIFDVEELGEMDVYDITVDAEEHTYWSGGLLVSNCGEISIADNACNLSELNVAALNRDNFYKAVWAAVTIGTLQATHTDFNYVQKKFRDNCYRESLLGVSLTGQAENWGLLADANFLSGAARFMVEVNKNVARSLGINPAYRIGTTKPSGSASTLLGSTPGIHGAYSDFFIRRMQIDKSSPLGQHLIETFGIHDAGSGNIIEHHYNKEGLLQVAAPHRAPNSIIASKERAVDLLERAQHIKKHWIAPSHVQGANHHNVSLTVYYKEEEREAIKDWVCANKEHASGISFFPHSGGTFKAVQMPYEEITADDYDVWMRKFDGISLDLENVDFSRSLDERISEPACAGGACLIV